MFSEYIRRRVYANGEACCERCGHMYIDRQKDNGDVFPAWKNLQSSHYHGRTSKATRFELLNYSALCGGCHMYLEHHPTEHTEFMKNKLGEVDYGILELRYLTTKKVDIAAVRIYLKQLLEGV